MQIVTEPMKEEDVLAVTFENVDADWVVEYIEAKAECCVVHLCGCTK